MALIKEDGSIVASANTYAEASDAKSYASLRNITCFDDLEDDEIEAHLIKAMDYIESHRARFKGVKVLSTQALQWPRSSVYIDGYLSANDEIPREIFYAQLAAAVESADGNNLQENSGPAVKREKLEGVGEVEYSNGGSVRQVNAFAKPEALLSAVLKNNGLTLVRV